MFIMDLSSLDKSTLFDGMSLSRIAQLACIDLRCNVIEHITKIGGLKVFDGG